MYAKLTTQFNEVNERNKQPNTLCYEYLIGNDTALVTVEDIYPVERGKEKFSAFICIEYLNTKIFVGVWIASYCVMIPKFKISPEDYRPIFLKIIMLHVGELAQKHKVDCVLFSVQDSDLFYSMNLPFWAWGFSKSSGSGRQVHTFAARLPIVAGNDGRD